MSGGTPARERAALRAGVLPGGVLAGGVLAGGLVGLGQALLDRVPDGALAGWAATNHRGRSLTLATGPLAAGAAAVGTGSRGAAALAAGAVLAGRYDDVVGARPEQLRDKGFRGHVAALRAGRVSAGAVKVLGIGGTSLTVAVARGGGASRGATRGGRLIGAVPDALLLAATANLVNLLDLRPGRALKVVALAATAEVASLGDEEARRTAAAVAGAALAALPADLDERTMLGDAGANGLGALLALPLLDASRPVRLGLLTGVLALTAASERVSFSAVIDRTPPLAWLDRLGRRALELSA